MFKLFSEHVGYSYVKKGGLPIIEFSIEPLVPRTRGVKVQISIPSTLWLYARLFSFLAVLRMLLKAEVYSTRQDRWLSYVKRGGLIITEETSRSEIQPDVIFRIIGG